MQDGIPCGRCGYPLPPTTIHHVVRDDSDPAVVTAVRDGSIHRSDCPRCGATGWLSIPMLWVDRLEQRAVFVAPDALRHDQRESILHDLIEEAFQDVPAELRESILRCLQRVRYSFEIPKALEIPADRAARLARAQDAFRRREALPPPQRLEQAIADAIAVGASYSEGRELSDEFVALAEAELAAIAPEDDGIRATVVRNIVGDLVRHKRSEKRAAVPAAPPFAKDRLPDVPGLAVRAHDPVATPASRITALQALSRAQLNAGRNDEAYAAARELIDLATNAGDARGRADGLVYAGVALSRAGRPEAAVNYLAPGMQEQHALPYAFWETRALGAEAAGDAYMQLRAFPAAKRVYAQAITSCERMQRPDALGAMLGRFANACVRMGEIPDAIDTCKRLMAMYAEDSEEGVHARLSYAVTLGVALGQGQSTVDDVLAAYESAHNAAVHIGAHSLELSARDGIANTLLEAHRITEARDVLEQSMRIQEQLGRTARAHTLVTLGSVWEQTAVQAWDAGEAQTARDAWEKALAFYERAVAASDGGYASHEQIVSGATRGQAICLEALGRHDEARRRYREAMGMFEGIRQYLLDRQQKEFVQGNSMILFPRAQRNDLALFAETGDVSVLEEAFHFAEAGRSRILLDLLGANTVEHPLTVDAIAAALPEDTAFVRYSLVPHYANRAGSWAIYTILPRTGLAPFVVQRDLEEVLDARNRFHAKVERLERAWHKGRRTLDGEAGWNAALRKLGALLLPEQLLAVLRERGIRRIVFAPEDYLFDVPFAALRVRWFRHIDDLCRSGVETIVIPSASAYIAAGGRRRRATAANSLLCISDPEKNLPGVSEWVDRNIRRKWRGATKHLMHEAASLTNVLGALPRSRFIVYYGHGSPDGLLLHDAPLTMRELASPALKLDCDLVLALACFGARVASDQRSRELLGLSSSLLQCGARNVIGGLWPLFDAFAEDFGARMMQYVADGIPIGSAQLRALNDVRIEDPRWNHPYVWSGVRLTGRG